MMPPPAPIAPPLRFLALVLGGWICLRAAVLAAGWLSVEQTASGAALAYRQPAAIVVEFGPRPAAALPAAAAHPPREAGRGEIHSLMSGTAYKRLSRGQVDLVSSPRAPVVPFESTATVGILAPAISPPPLPSPSLGLAAVPGAFAAATAPPSPDAGRWSGSAWLLARREQGAPALAPGGNLGGSQAGTRILYRLNGHPARPLALSGRLYLPLRRTQGAETAVGLDWQPVARLPVHILAERRQALGEEGRSAFALTVYGGISRPLPHGLRLDAYGQAGVVGIRARDLFADGSARIAAPAGPVELGGALRGAAQPGAARLDAGPELSVRIRAGPAALRLSADWRFRIAGDAAPDSGPALTLAADF